MIPDIERLREDFPTIKYKTFLNSAATGPAMLPVWKAVQEYWSLRMVDARHNPPKTRETAARFLNAKPNEICWVGRVTHGLNVVKDMLSLEAGDNVVITDLSYPSSVYVWLPFRSSGVEMRRIQNHGGMIELEDFEKAIDDHTGVVSISQTEWTSGLTYDLKALSEIAHEHGALMAIDAYQSMGAMDINAHRLNVDFLVSGGTKWLCCHTGAAILYIREELTEEFEPAYRFYSHVEEAFKDGAPWEREAHDNIKDYDKPLVKGASKFDYGCVTEPDLWGLNACLKYFMNVGMENIEEKTKELGGYLIEQLLELGLKVNTPQEKRKRGGLITYNTGKHELNRRSVEVLGRQNVVVSLRYQSGIGGVRVATHFFNTEEDVDRLISIQKTLLK